MKFLQFFSSSARLLALLSALVLLLGLGCAGEELPGGEPDLRGIITKVDTSPGRQRILVEENPDPLAGSAKAVVRLEEQTRIWRRTADGAEAVAAEALTLGATVSVWFAGPVAESYPLQGAAAAVVLES